MIVAGLPASVFCLPVVVVAIQLVSGIQSKQVRIVAVWPSAAYHDPAADVDHQHNARGDPVDSRTHSRSANWWKSLRAGNEYQQINRGLSFHWGRFTKFSRSIFPIHSRDPIFSVRLQP